MEIIGAKYLHSCVEFEGWAWRERAGLGRGAGPGRDLQDSIQKEGPYSNLKVAGSNPAGVFFLLPRLKQERKNSFLTLHRSEIFPHWSGNNRSELFPYLCGFHSYIYILVGKLFIPFWTVSTS